MPHLSIRLTSVLVCVFALSACGGDNNSPTAPSSPPPPPPTRIAGAWTGTLESNNYTAEAIDVELAQVAGTVNGTWAYPRGLAAGNVTGTVAQGQFSGNMTFNVRGGSTTCAASIAGSASDAELTWTSPGFTGACGLAGPNPLGVRLILRRR
jgi:hypothetical protein